MIKAHRITGENVACLQALYERFCARAGEDYRWTYAPLEFSQLAMALANKLVMGYWVEDTGCPEPIGLMLYRLEEHRAIEINLIYTESPDLKTILDRLMRAFIADNRDTEGWDVVSYAMLGKQEPFIRSILWYGFKPVGQAISYFDLTEPLGVQVLQQQNPELPGPEYTLDVWQPQYAGAVAEVIHESFSKAQDALWDPRFRTLLGTRKVVGTLTAGMMGKFLPSCTTVMLKNGVPVGVCFMIEESSTTANIPLIGVRKEEAGRKLGNYMLKASLSRVIQEFIAEKNTILRVSTTMDTDNIPAIKMYRRMGFREDYNYPHVYLTREKLLAFKPGKWC